MSFWWRRLASSMPRPTCCPLSGKGAVSCPARRSISASTFRAARTCFSVSIWTLSSRNGSRALPKPSGRSFAAGRSGSAGWMSVTLRSASGCAIQVIKPRRAPYSRSSAVLSILSTRAASSASNITSPALRHSRHRPLSSRSRSSADGSTPTAPRSLSSSVRARTASLSSFPALMTRKRSSGFSAAPQS